MTCITSGKTNASLRNQALTSIPSSANARLQGSNTSPSDIMKTAPYLYKEIVQIRDSLDQATTISVLVGETMKKSCEEPKTDGEIEMLEEVTKIMGSITDLYKDLDDMVYRIEQSLR